MEVLTNLIVIVISQSMHVSNHHLVHLRLTYLNKPGEKVSDYKDFCHCERSFFPDLIPIVTWKLSVRQFPTAG